MVKATSDHSYSRITLRPNDPDKRELFWEFRCEDISYIMWIFVLINSTIWVIYIFSYFVNPTDVARVKLLLATAYLLIHNTVWLLRRRFKKYFVYMLIFVCACSQSFAVISNSALIASTSFDNELQRSLALRSGYERIMRSAVLFCIFLSPSLNFTLIYQLIFCGGITWLSMLWGDLSKPQNIDSLSQQPLYAIVSFVSFYILQKRELKRFFEE